jgi:hypothetical protein
MNAITPKIKVTVSSIVFPSSTMNVFVVIVSLKVVLLIPVPKEPMTTHVKENSINRIDPIIENARFFLETPSKKIMNENKKDTNKVIINSSIYMLPSLFERGRGALNSTNLSISALYERNKKVLKFV